MQTQVNTMVFIGLACLALVVIAIVGTAYLRSISEKRRSAAAIKSLLDMMAENRSINRYGNTGCGVFKRGIQN